MSWRPEGWKNPFENLKTFTGIFETFYNTDNHKREKSAYEAGADAMLEALRSKGYMGQYPADGSISTFPEQKGTWVFIPDDSEVKQ